MLAGRGILPLARRTFWGVAEPDEEGAPRRVVRVAHQPVVALFAACIEIAAAHRLGVSAKPVCEFTSIMTDHHAASLSAMRKIG